MTDINSTQSDEVTFISGVDAAGHVAQTSFATWRDNFPATYSSVSYEAKWGANMAGTGAAITVAFDTASSWTATEQSSLKAAMDLWSAVANVTFTVVPAGTAAQVTITRASDGSASGGITDLRAGTELTDHLGHAVSGSLAIDTSVAGFGPINGSFSTAGGYVWMTMLHELGHVLGLGHAGAYDADEGGNQTPQYSAYDSRAWSIMSYIDVNDGSYSGSAAPGGGFNWGTSSGGQGTIYDDVPTTWMPLDVAAIQRVYGAATNSPLSGGGQVFGFHSNIAGDIGQFFDFTVNTKPVITLWDGGDNNTLDVSGYSQAAKISLVDGDWSSVGGLTNNIAIAYGTKIDTAIGGSGNDTISANAGNDYLMGGGGSDSLVGGAGCDHLFGNSASSVAGASDGGDTILTGDGMNYANGNGGNDHIVGGAGPDRLYGGQGDDTINSGDGSDWLNGNLGNDSLTAGNGNATLHGGQGNDVLHVGNGNDQLFGDVGNDTLYAGDGTDTLSGGDGRDVFAFGHNGAAPGHAVQAEVTDYADGTDLIALAYRLVDAAHLFHATGSVFASEADAEARAVVLLAGTPDSSAGVAALQVGSDTYLFASASGSDHALDHVIRLDHVSAGAIGYSDFTTVS